MMLIEILTSSPRTSRMVLALLMSVSLGAVPLLAQTASVRTSSGSLTRAEEFAGTWHWIFDGKSFSTMILVRTRSGFTGTVTPTRIALNKEGGLLRADPSEDNRPVAIRDAKLEGSSLRIVARDGFAFTVSLDDDTHAEIHPAGAPPNMKPIRAEKVH